MLGRPYRIRGTVVAAPDAGPNSAILRQISIKSTPFCPPWGSMLARLRRRDVAPGCR